MVADGRIARLKDPIHFSRCLHMTGVSLGSYISKPFSPITTSSHDIVMKMLSVMSKNISPISTSNHGIVMKMLSVICQSLFPPLQLVVTVLSWKCCQLYVNAFLLRYNWLSRYSHANAVSYMSKHFSPMTTSRHGIVMKMLSSIYQSLSLLLQLVVTVLS